MVALVGAKVTTTVQVVAEASVVPHPPPTPGNVPPLKANGATSAVGAIAVALAAPLLVT